MKNNISLEIVEAGQKYVGKNLAVLSVEDMGDLGIKSGDVIKIKGKEKDVYLRALMVDDISVGLIGLGGETRSVLGYSVGVSVSVLKVEKMPKLKSVTLSILQHEKFSDEELKGYNSQLKNSGEFRRILVDSPVSIGQKIIVPTSVGNLTYAITKCLPKKAEFGIVNEDTKVEVSEEVGAGSGMNIYYEDIGGLKEEIEKIREMVEFP